MEQLLKKGQFLPISGQLAMARFITRHGEYSSGNPEFFLNSPWRVQLLARRVASEPETIFVKQAPDTPIALYCFHTDV